MLRPWPVLFVLGGLLWSGTVPAAAGPSAASGDLRKALRQRFEGKLLRLHAPSGFDVLHYDTKGALTRPSSGEPWTMTGLVQADKVDVRDAQVMVDGRRVVLAIDPQSPTKKLVPVTTDRTVHIGIELPPAITRTSEANEYLNRVIAVDGVTRGIENVWRPAVDLSKSFDARQLPRDGKIGTLEGDRAVYAWESGVVSKPKALYKPGPKYPANALLKKVAGTIRVRVVVNERGFPEILEILEHLREGLDAHALAAVSQWRFEPGIREGVPTASAVVVELKFRLASRKS